jgi:hypothetical protein
MFYLLSAALWFAAPPADTFAETNRVAWCVVPFDKLKRTPAQRAEMLAGLGFSKFAYDWRAEHLPTFDAECAELQKRNIELFAVWFPAALNDDAKTLLKVIDRRKLKPQLWVMPAQPGKAGTDAAKAAEVAAGLKAVYAAAAERGLKFGLYNHGGWAGEPENMLAIAAALGPEAGIVYNLHHGHDHLDRFGKVLLAMKPRLLCLNLNGMTPGADKLGKKIMVLGTGESDRAILRDIQASGYRGPIGILGHTQDDAAETLRANIEGLRGLLK